MDASREARAFPPQRPPWQVMIHDGGELGFHYSLACHHALLDGWSVAQFNMQLFAAYREVLEGRTPDTRPALPFSVFVAEERLAAQSQEARTFWQQQLADAPLPWWTGAAGDPAGDEPHRRTWTLDRDEFDAIERVARACGVSDQTVFLALNLVLVSLLTGRTEALTSVVSHGRPALEGAEAALGLFLNTLPIRVQTRDLTWAALLARCEQQQIGDARASGLSAGADPGRDGPGLLRLALHLRQSARLCRGSRGGRRRRRAVCRPDELPARVRGRKKRKRVQLPAESRRGGNRVRSRLRRPHAALLPARHRPAAFRSRAPLSTAAACSASRSDRPC